MCKEVLSLYYEGYIRIFFFVSKITNALKKFTLAVVDKLELRAGVCI
jgi:hypothetical protein